MRLVQLDVTIFNSMVTDMEVNANGFSLNIRTGLVSVMPAYRWNER